MLPWVTDGLGKGNFWLFCDISGWHWYYAGLSEILCSGHSMTIRSMYAKQTEGGQACAADHSPRDSGSVRQWADER
jgi:hypothetical protein